MLMVLYNAMFRCRRAFGDKWFVCLLDAEKGGVGVY